MAEMEYRRLGRSGLRVSVFGFGSWVTFANKDQIGYTQLRLEYPLLPAGANLTVLQAEEL